MALVVNKIKIILNCFSGKEGCLKKKVAWYVDVIIIIWNND